MLNERFQIQAEQDAIIDSTPIAVRKDWQYRGNVMHVELWTPGWTLYDSTTFKVTTEAPSGMYDIHVTDTTGMVAGYEYVLTDGTNTENIKVVTVNTETNFTVATALSNTYTTGATIKRSNFTVNIGHAVAGDNDVLYIGPLDAGNNDAIKSLIIKRTESPTTLTVYFKNAASVTSWTSAAIRTTRYSGTSEYEVEYAVPTRGDTEFKIVCDGTEVVIHSMFFMDVTEFKTITTNTTFYLSPSGSDTTGKGTTLAPWKTLNAAILYLQDYWIASNVIVTLQLDDGPYTYSSSVVVDHPCGDRIIIKGKTEKNVNITSLVSTSITYTGEDFEIWSMVLGVGSTYQITSDDYLVVHTLPSQSGTDMYGLGSLFGCHKITNVDDANGRLTIEVRQAKTAVPDPVQIPSTSAYVLKSVINTTADYGIALLYNQSLGAVHNIAIVGGHAERNLVGIAVLEGSTLTMSRVGIVGFNAYGIQVQHNSSVVCYNKYGYSGTIALSGNTNGTYVKAASVLTSYFKFIISGSYIGHTAESAVIYMHPDTYIMSGLYNYGVQSLTNSFVFTYNTIAYAVAPAVEGGGIVGFIFYAAVGGVIWADGDNLDIGDCGSFSSPAANTVSSSQGYIHT